MTVAVLTVAVERVVEAVAVFEPVGGAGASEQQYCH